MMLSIGLLYGPVLTNLDTAIPAQGEDAAKNFYTVAYHIQHDASYWWFEGMNHPFGDHVTFTDNQPLVSNFLKLLGLPAITIFYLVFLSMLAGALCLFQLLRHWEVPCLPALIGAVGMSLLSPQLFRLGGHYSLAYAGLIPMAMYLVTQHRHAVGRVITAIFVLATAFIHPYFLPMLVLFWFGHESLVALEKGGKNWWHLSWPMASLIAFPVLMWALDPINDRPDAPYGFLTYRATWDSIMLPLDLPYFSRFTPQFANGMEGSHYLGFVAIAGGIWSLLRWCFRRPWNLRFQPHQRVFIAALPLLLLSVGFPFYIEPLDQLLPFTGPLQQFRGIARFAFVFFYAANLFAIGAIFRQVRGGNKIMIASMTAALALVMGFEAVQMQAAVITKTHPGIAPFHTENLSSEMIPVEAAHAQSMATIPFFHIGTEQLRFGASEHFRERCFAISMATGIPMHSSQMSRTSLQQGIQLAAMHRTVGQPALVDSLLDPERPVLLVVDPNHACELYERQLIEQAAPINGPTGTRAYLIEPGAWHELFEINKAWAEKLQQDSTTTPVENAPYYQSFEQGEGSSFRSLPSIAVDRSQWFELIPTGWEVRDTGDYELSFWIKADEPGAANAQLWFWERDGDDEVRFEVSEVGDHCQQLLSGWMLCALQFEPKQVGNTLEVRLHRDGAPVKIHLSEVLLRKQAHVYFRPGLLNINNRYIEPQ